MVIFDKERHIYTNPDTNERYISVSQLLKLYKEPFKKDFLAAKVAKKEKVTKEEILERWEKNNKEACDKGTNIHSILEKYIKDDIVEDRALIDELQKVFDKRYYRKINSEYIVYSDEHKVAGTSDCIADVDEIHFDVMDFKTNKKFNFENRYGEYLKTPLNNLQQCQYNDYSLQLSLYAYLYSQLTGKKLRKIEIFYYDGKFKSIPIPYMYWDIIVLLKHYGQAITKQSQDNTTGMYS
jgi:hypothetical protein